MNNNIIKLQKLNYIDAVRGIAILMVLLTHSAQHGIVKMPHFFSVFLSLGAKGVQLFFIASAFTLFRSYKNRVTTEKSPVGSFFIRSFFRIAPLYYLAIVYYVFGIIYNLPFLSGIQYYISKWNMFSNVFFVNGISPYWINSLVPGGWSITVEMFFYMLFPFLFQKIKNINLAFIFLNVSLFVKLLLQELFQYFNFISDTYLWREFLFYYFPSQLPIFALGIVLFFLIENVENLKSVTHTQLYFFFILLPLQVGSKIDFLYFNHIVFGIIFLIFIVFLNKGKLNFVCNSIIMYIGKISFSMYVIHFIVIAWLKRFDLVDFCNYYLMNFWLRFLLTLILSILFSTITYHLIEIPFQNIAKKLTAKKNSRVKL